jgi:hypothetical protein
LLKNHTIILIFSWGAAKAVRTSFFYELKSKKRGVLQEKMDEEPSLEGIFYW